MKTLDYLSEECQIEIISKFPWKIDNITNPSIKVQLAAVRRHGWIIASIKDPPLEVQKEAIKQDPTSLIYIKV